MEPLERRAQILGHAARLFGDKGYHDTSISDIITAAGVARGTFYLYFESKRGIFDELLNSLLTDTIGCIESVEVEVDTSSVREQLVDNITRVIDLFSDSRHMLTILFKGAVGIDREFDEKIAAFYDKIVDEIVSSLTLGQKMGLVRPCNAHFTARMALGVFKEMLHELVEKDSALDIDHREIASEVLDLFFSGVLVNGVSIP